MTTALSDPLIGRVLDGRYKIVSRIARGGMATVYEALDQRLDRVVAVKSMHADLVRDDDFVARFIHEAHSAARLGHPNVVAVFDQGAAGDPYSRHRVVYLVMEMIRGRTLRQLLRERGPLPPADALAVIEPVLAALRAAHEARIVHRDIKPENVLLADDGRVKVADFGLARALSADSGHTRASGLLLGTVSYLAPEQVLETGTDARADVYAAGIVLFEMLTGTKPFSADSPLNVAYKHVNERVPAPSSRVSGIPPALDRLVLRATDRDPDGRFVDGRDFLAAARGVAADLAADLAAGRTAGHATGPAADPAPGPRPAVSTSVSAGVRVSTGARSASAREVEGSAFPDQEPAAVTTRVSRPAARPGGRGPSVPVPEWSGRVPAAHGAVAAGHPRRTDEAGSTRRDAARGDSRPSTASPSTASPSTASPTVGAAPRRVRGRKRTGSRRDAGRSLSLAEQRTRHERLARRRRRRGAAAVVVVLLVATAFGVAAWWFGSGRFTTVPALAGTSELTARARLATADLRMQVSGTRFDAGIPAGYVLAAQQPPNARVERGQAVQVVVSRGTRQTPVPVVVGTTEAAARASLRTASLTVGKLTRITADQPSGQVTSSDPAAGTTLPAAARVDLVVSTGPAPVANPLVVGQPVAAATAAVRAAGLPVVVVAKPSVTVPAGVVLAAEPGEGPVPAHTPVTLTVSAGRPVVTVPDGLQGSDTATATRRLTALGFTVTVRRAPQWVGLNQVWSSDPAVGSLLPYGSAIVLTVI